MNFKQVFLSLSILLQLWLSETASTYNSRQTNRKQKKIIEGSMDLKANPCNDFYQFACGNWDEVFLEAGTKYYEPITMLDYNVNKEMSGVFKRFIPRNKPKFIQNAYNYYTSCVDLSKYEAVKYLVWLKANDQFKWPSLWTPPKKNTQFDWVQTLAKMRTYGLNDVFIQQIVMSQINDVKSFIIDIDKPVMDDGFKPLTEVNLNVLMNSLPAAISTEELQKLWLEIESFEKKLQELDEIEDSEVENEEDYIKERSIYVKDLPLDWLKDYLKVILNQTDLNPHMPLYIQNIPYMKALDSLLKQYTQRFICKYLEIRFLWHLHQDGPANFLDEDCLSSTRSLMSTAMHWLYEEQHPELAREYASIYEMFNNVRKHFNNTIIKNNHGFNATVIEYLQNKINNMKLRLNNIPRSGTVATLEKFYQPLDLDAEKFYENHLKLLRFNFEARQQLLNSKTTILDFTYLENSETGSSSSPFFVQNANYIFVPLTLLQPPIYSPDMDDIYKYSSLGFLLAHEMFHGFDDSGLLTDANGSMSLIQFEENPLFNASFNCLLELNPLVISEKIADVSGLRYAYQAFFDANPDARTKTRRIYGQEISMSKVFFLNFAQFFCGNTSPDEFSSMSDHGSDRERVTDALTHFPEFAKTFSCSRQHRMYPHDACHLWR
ncbi:membrane metallo-endopeptidase-like 1 [Lucilia cuprina]|uniref:membrane metallo-endopeptidase-like 1 n=1 Tax=Lucilia cuprina TaxID=7375 RepID=UPI001F05B9CD|nr:membrane metallo-endopeptidase-like 1 [Lucilia cuprina]